MTAAALTDGPAEVTLRRPPPLDRPLRVERRETGVVLLDGEEVVSEGRPLSSPVESIAPISYDDALSAARDFDLDEYTAAHPFPVCFACGPGRAEGDGLRLFPAETHGHHDAIVWPWIPSEGVTDAEGRVDTPTLWAALDCPSGLGWIARHAGIGPAVLARMATVVHRHPLRGERLVVAGWPLDRDGRKLHSGSAVWSEDGTVLAACSALWIELTGDQLRAFGVDPTPGA